jgi:xanthine dehydrogenase accessory factor
VGDWLTGGLQDDMRPFMFDAADSGQPFALATIIEADGGPRPVGSQMVVTADAAWGFLSGGCVEADVALHARAVLADRAPRTLVYGRGSPFIDIRLPCGGRIEILIEGVDADDGALARLRELTARRISALWESDGRERRCLPADEAPGPLWDLAFRRIYEPPQRLLVVGSDPFALAMAGLGALVGWETTLLAPFGPADEPPVGVRCDRRPVRVALEKIALDPWTAIAVATHDLTTDQDVLAPALRSRAAYVGVLGSRRRLEERILELRRAGLTESEIGRLRAPIGLAIGARSPWEVAVAVAGEIVSVANGEQAVVRIPLPIAEQAARVH